ncbi:MAG TPA: hypothetical protein VH186_19525 [Chloroflexia bacterium]|nr:hypothetical protein [Chloroflexia bacterium]
MKCEECQQELWKAGDIVPPGRYARVDDRSYRIVVLEKAGPLPVSYDGHTAFYSPAGCRCSLQDNTAHAW